MKNTQNFISKQADRFLNELIILLKIPSVSADPAYKSQVNDCAKHLANSFKEIGLDKIEICQTAGYPIVYG
jgi:acetylornithine deacetylase/succinyl-diaminopimelate desuccinylase-like protein